MRPDDEKAVRKGIPSRVSSKCEGSEAGMSLTPSENSSQSSVQG